jgi:hypothetical protein
VTDALDSALDRLYAVPLDDFTATRNALAKELAGDDAKQVKALKKPNIAAWALNQLARTDELAALFTVTDKLRRAQRRVMSGGKPAELRQATDERNKVVSALTKRAGEILAEAGHAAAASTLSAVSDSLVAVASDDVGAELLRRGRLTRELHPQSVVDVGGLTLVESDEAPDEPELPDLTALEAARDAVEEARKRVKEATAAVTEANRDVEKLSLEADAAERRAKSARESAEFAKRAAEARAEELQSAEAALEEARKTLRDAQRS